MAPTLLILTANNSYSGSTTIASGGTLQIGNGSFNGSIGNSSAIVYNGLLVFDVTSGTTLSHVISGSGGLTQAGASMLILTASNTYTGPTTISAGTLEIGNGGSIGGSSGVANNGVLEFNLSSGTTTVTGVISGSGSLTQNNSSVVVLTGSDTYTGLTTIGSGTLQIGNGGNTGSINNTSGITGNGTLAYDLSTPTTLAVSVTGGLSLMQAGSGVLTITSSETYTGSTIIASGATLQLGNGGSINSTNTISDSGTVAFDYSSRRPSRRTSAAPAA